MIAGRRDGERGFALLLVLWIFTILGVLALDFARYIRDDAMSVVNLVEETRGYYVALSGMQYALYAQARVGESRTGLPDPGAASEMMPDGDLQDLAVPLDGQWHEGTLVGGRYAVRITDEGGRISLNGAQEPLLTRVVTSIVRGGNATTGLDRQAAGDVAEIVDSILDWRDGDDLARLHGAESDYYLGLASPYRAKNMIFTFVDELLQVRGITPAVFFGSSEKPGLRDVFSVYTKTRGINANTITPAVVQVLLDTDAAEAQELIALRDSDPGNFGNILAARLLQVDASVARLVKPRSPKVVTIEGRGDLANERNQSRVAMVAELMEEGALTEDYRVLQWLDRAPWEGGIPMDDTGHEAS